VGISRLRKRVVFERLLARLQAVAPGAWVLKGGFALELRLGGSARTTKDVDIDWNVDEQEAVELLLAAAPVLEPETVASSHLLDFAGREALRVPALAIEQHVAEKLHAYTRTYAGDKPSSRIKDLVDLVVIAHTTTIDADKLELATGAIFERRATHPVPVAVPAPPVDWAPGWRRLVADMPVEGDVRAGHFAAAEFLDPVLSRNVTSGRWDPDAREWLDPEFDQRSL
jgi:hypothetical protein